MVYRKPSLLMRVILLKSPINTKTAMYKIKTLRGKWYYENHTHTHTHTHILKMTACKSIINRHENISDGVLCNDVFLAECCHGD
jgi:hypothetical protein